MLDNGHGSGARERGIAALLRWQKRHNLTNDELRDILGIGRTTLWRWKGGGAVSVEHRRIVLRKTGVDIRPRRGR